MLGRCSIDVTHLPEAPGVYRIVNRETGDSYVGGSGNVRKRAYGHAIQLANGDHICREMQKSYAANAGAFAIELLCRCDFSDLNDREEAWINEAKPTFNQFMVVRRSRDPIDRFTIRERQAKRQGRIVKPRISKQPKIPKPSRIPKPKVKRFTHDERRARRLEMAIEYEGGAAAANLAIKYGVSEETVINAVHEFQVRLHVPRKNSPYIPDHFGVPKKRGPKAHQRYDSMVKKVQWSMWESLDWTRRDIELAKVVNVSRERVRQVRRILGKPKPLAHYMRLSQTA